MTSNANQDEEKQIPPGSADAGSSGNMKLPANPVPVEVETISIDDYIKASVLAGDRVRRLLYILIFASAIAFMAYWNSIDTGWINSRFKNIQEAEEKYIDVAKSDTANTILKSKFPCSRDEIQVDSFLLKRDINSVSKIRDYEKMFQDLSVNTYRVNVPILGVFFDINDLGVFAGCTFLFLLFLLASSIVRESENLDLTFQFAVQNKILNNIYIYLTMGQVLSYPPKPYSNAVTERPFLRRIVFFTKQNISKAFYLVPVLVELFIVWNDGKTKDSGSSLNPELTESEYHWSIFILFCNLAAASLCIYRTYKIDQLWNVYFKESTLDISPGKTT